MTASDPHSFADDAQPSVRSIDLRLLVNFETSVLEGAVDLHLDGAAGGCLDLDTRGLQIESVQDASGSPVPFELSDEDAILGRRLRLRLEGDLVRIRYQTSAAASALQWLTPAQTAGGAHPYVFTQCQPIHARSLFPCQDTPRVRIQYTATLDVPVALRAVMAAAHVGRREDGGRAIETFEMTQPIPTYLFAFAVGDLASRDLGPRSRVYAEPAILEDAAREFEGVDAMISTAEGLFGPYDWERFDLLVMPPSFPYGGMENPRLTFLTPTLIAHDRSLVNVVAHELAHSWTGNLVTNATMNDFWLNEGFTTYAERRILEALEGEEAVALQMALGREGLEAEVKRFGPCSPLTRLRNELEGVDPDEVYSRVPYEKGFLMVLRIERVLGRKAFDALLKTYIQTFRFKSIITADFLEFLKVQAQGIEDQIDFGIWLDGTGIPPDAPTVRSSKLEAVTARTRRHRDGDPITTDDVTGWTVHEWLIFLGGLPAQLSTAECARLDAQFDFTASRNSEIRCAWLTIAANSDYEPAFDAIRETLGSVGRMKYLRPLYSALAGGSARTNALATEIFAGAQSAYHPVAKAMVEHLLEDGA